MMLSMQVQTYRDILLTITRGSYKGTFINAKPLLFLTVIKAIENKKVIDNKIYFSKEIEKAYKEITKEYGFPITPFFKPYYYLSYESFWHLKWKTIAYNEQHPSPKFIRENIEFAYLDDVLWNILQDPETRDLFIKSIEDYYLK